MYKCKRDFTNLAFPTRQSVRECHFQVNYPLPLPGALLDIEAIFRLIYSQIFKRKMHLHLKLIYGSFEQTCQLLFSTSLQLSVPGLFFYAPQT